MSSTATLNTGAVIPTVGLGLWKSGEGEVKRAVITALEQGAVPFTQPHAPRTTAAGHCTSPEVHDLQLVLTAACACLARATATLYQSIHPAYPLAGPSCPTTTSIGHTPTSGES
jgi:hypothetical protein